MSKMKYLCVLIVLIFLIIVNSQIFSYYKRIEIPNLNKKLNTITNRNEFIPKFILIKNDISRISNNRSDKNAMNQFNSYNLYKIKNKNKNKKKKKKKKIKSFIISNKMYRKKLDLYYKLFKNPFKYNDLPFPTNNYQLTYLRNKRLYSPNHTYIISLILSQLMIFIGFYMIFSDYRLLLCFINLADIMDAITLSLGHSLTK